MELRQPDDQASRHGTTDLHLERSVHTCRQWKAPTGGFSFCFCGSKLGPWHTLHSQPHVPRKPHARVSCCCCVKVSGAGLGQETGRDVVSSGQAQRGAPWLPRLAGAQKPPKRGLLFHHTQCIFALWRLNAAETGDNWGKGPVFSWQDFGAMLLTPLALAHAGDWRTSDWNPAPARVTAN